MRNVGRQLLGLLCVVATSCTQAYDSGAVDQAASEVVARPKEQAADGNSVINVDVTVRSKGNAPLAGWTPELQLADANVVVDAAAPTDGNGFTRLQLRSPVPAQGNVDVTLRGSSPLGGQAELQDAPSFSFSTAVPTQPGLALRQLSANTVANGEDWAEVRINGRRPDDAPWAGGEVRLAGLLATDTMQPSSVVLDETGSALVRVRTTVAGTRALVATLSDQQASAPLRFAAGPPNFARSLLIVERRVAAGNGRDPLPVMVRLVDDFNNPVDNYVVTLQSDSAGVAFDPATGLTDADGVFTTQMRSVVLGEVQVAAEIGGQRLGDVATFQVGPVDPAHSSLTPPGQVTTADGASLAPLVLFLRDAADHPIGGVEVKVSKGQSLLATSRLLADNEDMITDANGTLTFSVSSMLVGNVPVAASVAGVDVVAQVPFGPGAPSGVMSAVLGGNITLLADGNARAGLVVLLRDEFGHPVSDTFVRLTSPWLDVQLDPPEGVTDVTGRLTTQASGKKAGEAIVMATLDKTNLWTKVRLVAGLASKAHSQLVVEPESVTADGMATANVHVVLRDTFGNLVPEGSVRLRAVGQGIRLAAPLGTSSSEGRYQTSLTGSAALLGSVVLELTDGEVTAPVRLLPAAADAARSTLQATPAAGVVADGVQATQLRLLVLDQRGNPIPGQAVVLRTDGAGDSLVPSAAVADAQGRVVTTLRSTRAGSKQVTAELGEVQLRTVVTFVPGPADVGHSVLRCSPDEVVADGTSATSVALQLRDAYDNALPAAPVTLSSSGAGSAISLAGSASCTDAAGNLAAFWRSSVAGPKTLTVALGAGGQLRCNVSFIAGAVANAQSVVALMPQPLVAGGPAGLVTVALRDAQGNAVPNMPYELRLVGSGVSLGASTGATGADGNRSVAISATVAGSRTVIVEVDGTSLTQTFAVVAGPPQLANSSLTTQPQVAAADGQHFPQVILQLRDPYGNPAGNQAVRLRDASATDTAFVPAEGVTAADGTFVAQVRSTRVGVHVLEADTLAGTLRAGLTMVPGAVAATQSALTAAPAVGVADAIAGPVLTWLAKDAAGNPVPGCTVAWQVVAGDADGGGAGNGNDVVTPLLSGQTTTGTGGSLTVQLRGTKAGSRTVQGTCAGVTLAANVQLVAGPAVAPATVLSLQPAGSLVADGAQSLNFVLHAKDVYGNPAAGQAFVLTAPGVTLEPAGGVLDGNGEVTGTVRGTVAQATTVVAQVGAAAAGQPLVLVAGPAAAAHTRLRLLPASVVADGLTPAQVVVEAADAFGNAVVGAEVRLTTSLGTLAQTTLLTGADGSARTLLTGELLGTAVVTARVGAVEVQQSLQLVVGRPDAGSVTLTASPNVLIPGAPEVAVLTLTGKDRSGHALSGREVHFSATGPASLELPSGSITLDGNGQCEVPLRATALGAIEVTAAIDGAAASTTVQAQAGAVDPNRSVFDVVPAQLVADGVSQATLRARLVDAYGNPLVGTGVAFTSTGVGDTFGGPTTVTTGPNGLALATLQVQGVGVRTVQVQQGGLTWTAPLTVVAGAPALVQSSFAVVPTPLVAGDANGALLQGILRDAVGNPVAGADVTWTAVGGADVHLATADGPLVQTATTDSNGQVRTQIYATAAGDLPVQLRAEGVTLLANVAVVPGAVDALQSHFFANVAEMVAADGNDSGAALVLQLRDAWGNRIAGQAVQLASAGNGLLLAPPAATTDGNGIVAARASGTVAGLQQVEATAQNVTLSLPLTVVPGPLDVAQSQWLADAGNVTVGQNSNASYTLYARDSYGNPIVGQLVQVAVAASSDAGGAGGAGGAVTVPPSGLTDANGMFRSQVYTDAAGVYAVASTAGAVTVTSDVQFLAGAANFALSRLQATPLRSPVVADGTAALQLALQLVDDFGNPVAGAAVDFQAPGDANGAIAWGPGAGVTDGNGRLTVEVASTAAGAHQVVANVAGGQLATTLTWLAGAVDLAHSSVALVGDGARADGQGGITVQIRARDLFGNPVGGAAVSLNDMLPAALVAPAATTAADGSWTATLTTTVAGAHPLQVQLAGQTQPLTATFVAGPLAVGQSSLLAQNNPAVADGQQAVALQLMARDAFANPLVGQGVRWTTDAPEVVVTDAAGNAVGAGTGTLDGGGQATAFLRSHKALPSVVSATVGGSALHLPVAFVAGAADLAQSRLQVAPSVVSANGTTAGQIVVLLADAFGNPVGGAQVVLTADGGDSRFGAGQGSTDGNGRYVDQLASTAVGSKQLVAQAGNLTLTAALDFVVGAPTAQTVSLVAEPPRVVPGAGELVTLRFFGQDAEGAALAGVAVQFAAVGGNVQLGANSCTTDAAGQCTVTLTASGLGSSQIIASVAGAATDVTVAAVAGAPDAQASTLLAEPSEVVADGSGQSLLVARLVDAYGNVCADVAGQFVATGASGTTQAGAEPSAGPDVLVAATPATTATGTQLATLRSTLAESKTVSWSGGNVTLAANVTFVPGPLQLASSSLVATPTVVVADGVSEASLLAQIRDASGNPLRSVPVRLHTDGNVAMFAAAPGASGSPSFVATTDGNGTLAAVVRSSVAGAIPLLLDVAGGQLATTVDFVPGAVAPGSSQLTASPVVLVAATDVLSTVEGSLRDALGNRIGGAAVVLSAADGNVQLSATHLTTDANGAFVAQAQSRRTGCSTLTATVVASGQTLTTSVCFAAGAVDPNQSTWSTSTATVPADGLAEATLTLEARDAYGNPVPQAGVQFAASGSGATLNPASGVTDGKGRLAATLRAQRAEDKVATAFVGGHTFSLPVRFVAGDVATATSTLVATPTTAIADGQEAIAVVAQAYDLLHNPVANLAVALSSDGADDQGLAAPVATDAQGVARFALRGTRSGLRQIRWALAGGNKAVQVALLAGPAAAERSLLTLTPKEVLADGQQAAVVAVVVRDAFGNPVANQAVALSSSGDVAQSWLTPVTGTTDATGSFQASLRTRVAATQRVVATAGALQLQGNVTFVAGPPTAGQSLLATDPAAGAVADGNAPLTVTLCGRDAVGNPTPGQPFVVAGQTGTLDGNGCWYGTLRSSVATSGILTATVGTTSLQAPYVFVAGAPVIGQSVLSVSPTQLEADGLAQAEVVVALRDALANPVANAAVALAATGGNNWLTPAAGTTDATGTWRTTWRSDVPERKQLQASGTGFVLTTEVDFVVGPPDAQAITFVAEANQVLAQSGDRVRLVVTARDSYGQRIAGQSVTFASDANSGADLQPTSGVTGADGTLAVSVALAQLGPVRVQAQLGEATVERWIEGTSGPVDPNRSVWAASPAVATADGLQIVVLTATLRDRFGNPVVGATPSFALVGGGTLSPAPAPSDGAGISRVGVTATVAGDKVAQLTIDGHTLQAPLRFVAGTAASALSSLTAAPAPQVADGTEVMVLTAQFADSLANPLANVPVTVAVSGNDVRLANGPLGTLYAGSTDAAGRVQIPVTATVAEIKTAQATVAGCPLLLPLQFVAGPPVAEKSRFVVTPERTVADGTSVATLGLRLRDAFGNPVPAASVTLDNVAAGLMVAATSGATDTDGLWTTTVTSSQAGCSPLAVRVDPTHLQLTTEVCFAAGATSLVGSTWTADKTQAVANGNDPIALAVRLRDAAGNPVVGAAVGFSVDGGGGTLLPSNAVTAADGSAHTRLSSLVAEDKNVTVSTEAGVLVQSVRFVAGAVDGVRSQITALPSPVVADGQMPAYVDVVALDAAGNRVAGAPVQLASSVAGDVLLPPTGVTDATGHWRAQVTGVTAGPHTLTVTLAGQARTLPLPFVAGAVDGLRSTLVASPNVAVANGVFVLPLTVVARDGHGNPIAGQAVHLTATGRSNAFGTTSGFTDASGTFATTLASTAAEHKNVIADFGGAATATQVAFIAGPPAPATSQLTLTPNTLLADGTSATAAIASFADAFGNACANVTVQFASTGAGNAMAPLVVLTDDQGVATTQLRSTVAETKRVSATAGSVTMGGNVVAVPGTLSPTLSMLLASPNQVVADDVASTVVVIRARDAQGNNLPGQSVSFSAPGSEVKFASAFGVTDGNGSYTTTASAKKAGRHRLVAVVAGSALQQNVLFVAGPVSASQSSVVAQPSQVTADGQQTIGLVVTAVDAFGNPVANQPVALSGSGGNNLFVPSAGVTDAQGAFFATVQSAYAKRVTITASIGSTAVTCDAAFVAGAPTNQTLHLSYVPAGAVLTADGQQQATLVLDVTDALGNPVAARPVHWSVDGGSTTFVPQATATNAAGQATATLTSTVAGNKTVAADLGGGLSISRTVPFAAGPPKAASSALVATPTTVVANGHSQADVTLTLRDGAGNPVAGIDVTFASAGDGVTLGTSRTTTDSLGVAATTVRRLLAASTTVVASFAGGSLQVPIAFVHGPLDNGASSLRASPNVVLADGVAVANVVALLRDAAGNPVDGAQICFAATGASSLFGADCVTADATGAAATTLAARRTGVHVVTAASGNTALQTAVTFVPGPPASATSTLAVAPNQVVADGNAAAQLLVDVRDAAGNAVPDLAVTWRYDGAEAVLSQHSSLTDAAGHAHTSLRAISSGPRLITADVGGNSLQGSVVFVPGPLDAGQSSWTAVPTEVVANGNDAAVLTLTLLDGQRNPLVGQAVQVGANGSGNTFAPATGVTDAAGHFVTTLRTTRAQTKWVTASVGALVLTTPVRFVAGAPSAQTVTLTADANVLVADGTTATTLRYAMVDATGNPVSGAQVNFACVGSGCALQPATAVTDANGLATTQLTGSTAGIISVQATSLGVSAVQQVVLQAGAAAAGTSTLTLTPNVALADGNATVRVVLALRDAQQNAVAGQAVTLSAGGSANAFAATTGVTDAGGLWSTTWRSSVAEHKIVQVLGGGVALQSEATFVAGAASAASSLLSVAPATTVADGAAQATARIVVRDAQGNVAPGRTVTFAATGDEVVLAATQASTDANGVAQTTLTSTRVGDKLVTAAVDKTSVTSHATFVAGPPVGAGLKLSASATGAVADDAAGVVVTLQVRDAYNNLVPGQAVSFAATGSGNRFAPTDGVTDLAGVVSTTLRSTRAEAKVVTASVAGLSATLPLVYTAGLPVSQGATLTVSPNATVADNVAAATLQLTVVDAFGNPVPNFTVSWGATGTANALAPERTTTDADGKVRCTLTSTKAQTKAVTATFYPGSATTNAVFVAGPADGNQSALSLSPNLVEASDQGQNASLDVMVRDRYQNPVGNQSVSFSAVGIGNVFASANCTTNAAGLCSGKMSSTVVQTEVITATYAAATSQAALSVVAAPPSATTSLLLLNANQSYLADGTDTIGATVVARDAYGNACPAQAVSWSSSGSTNVFAPATGTTTAFGLATTRWSSTTAERKILRAQVGGAVLTREAAFMRAPLAASRAAFGAVPVQVAVGRNGTLVFAANDANGVGIANAAVVLNTMAADATITPSVGWTDSNGYFAAAVQSPTPGQTPFLASAANVTLQANVTFYRPGPAVALRLASVHGGVAPATSDAVVTALDANGRPASDYVGTVRFTSTDGNAALPSSYTFVPADGGTHTFARGVTLASLATHNVAITDGGGLAASQNGLVVASTVDYGYYTVANASLAGQVLTNPNTGALGFQQTSAVRTGRFGQVWALGSDGSLRQQEACLGLAGPMGPGQRVLTQACTDDAQQRWAAVGTAIVNLADPNYCLTSSLAGTPQGTTVMPCRAALAQNFVLHNTPPTYNVVAVGASNCLTVSGYVNLTGLPLLGSGAGVQTCKASADQTFFFDQAQNLRQSGQCLEPQGAVPTSGASVVTNNCTGAAKQRWTSVGQTLRPASNPNYCLDMGYVLLGLGTTVQIGPCSGSATQQVLAMGQATFHDIVVPATATTQPTCVAINPNTSMLQGQACGPLQASTFTSAVPAFTATSFSPTYDTSIAWGATTLGTNQNVAAANNVWGNSQGFVPVFYADGSMGVSSLLLSGQCLDSGAGAVGTPTRLQNCNSSVASQRFYRSPRGYSMQPLQNPNVCLASKDSATAAGTPMVYDSCSDKTPGQRVGMVPTYVPNLTNASRSAFLATFGNRCLTAAGSVAAGTPLALGDCTFDGNQLMWTLGPGGQLKLLYSNLCVDAAAPTVGSTVKLATCAAGTNQQFGMR